MLRIEKPNIPIEAQIYLDNVKKNGELNKNDFDLFIDLLFEPHIKKERDSIFIAILSLFIGVLSIGGLNSSTEFYLKFLTTISLISISITLFLLLWNKLRFPLKFKKLKDEIYINIKILLEKKTSYLEEVVNPLSIGYMKNSMDSGLIKDNDHLKTISKEVFYKAAEFFNKEINELLIYRIENAAQSIFEKKNKDEKYSGFKLFLDKTSFDYRSVFIVISIILFVLFIIYKLTFSWIS